LRIVKPGGIADPGLFLDAVLGDRAAPHRFYLLAGHARFGGLEGRLQPFDTARFAM
jgi:hypothetical protein